MGNRISALSVALVLVCLGAGLTDGGTVARAEQGGARCSFNYDNGVISPGVMATETRSASWSAGPASLTCEGSVDGQEITGPGVITEYGTLDGTCTQASGSGWQIGTVPTARGVVRFENPVTFRWIGAVGPYSGPRLRGTFESWPMAGDCLKQPMTRYGQLTQGTLTSP
jgi:hypothetical protein